MHIADLEGDSNPLSATAAFSAFQQSVVERCDEGEGPNAQQATVVGSYRFFDR